MEFIVHYIMDDVGYSRTVEAESKEQAIVKCVEDLREAYPASVCDIKDVEVVEEEEKEVVEKKKTTKKKREG